MEYLKRKRLKDEDFEGFKKLVKIKLFFGKSFHWLTHVFVSHLLEQKLSRGM
jgi:hypothetical protein